MVDSTIQLYHSILGATYHRVMTAIFHDMLHECLEEYVDDNVEKSREACHHIDDLIEGLHQMQAI